MNILNEETCRWQPTFHSAVPWWHGHIPFAFSLIAAAKPRRLVELGTHRGDSYMAFCQAATVLGLEAEFYAVDNWTGDRHVGQLAESVYSDLKAYHDARYASFSTLVRKTFDAAVDDFEPGSIDVLHIDGGHEYDDVSNDVRRWLPKLSDRGVLLLHDIAVNRDDFGVNRVWLELIDAFRDSFAFDHSCGLGVLGVGTKVPWDVTTLFALDQNQAGTVRDRFRRLGKRLMKRIDSPENRRRVRTLPRFDATDLTPAAVG